MGMHPAMDLPELDSVKLDFFDKEEEKRRNSLFMRFLKIKENILQFKKTLETSNFSNEFSLSEYGFDKLISNLTQYEHETSESEMIKLKDHIKLLSNQLEKRVASIKNSEKDLKIYFTDFEKHIELLTTAFSPNNEAVLPLSNEIMIVCYNFIKIEKSDQKV
ncbi:hypothetical protein HZS_7892 [Henneguya salminicola]|nr:hypothetical protein HZS_7892 [Henneguya salminicola]